MGHPRQHTGFGFLRVAAVVLGAMLLWPSLGSTPAASQETLDLLTPRLTAKAIQAAFPGAYELGPAEGRPPALPVYIGGELAGYIFSTRDLIFLRGYGGTPFDLIGGVTIDGKITGAYLLYHNEPIIPPVPEELLLNYVAGFGGATLTDFTMIKPNVVKGATVSARLIRNGIREVARMVYRGQVEGGDGELALVAELDLYGFHELTWDQMVAQGTVGREIVTNKDIRKMFKKEGGAGAAPDGLMVGDDGDTFAGLYVSLVNPPSVGRNLFNQYSFWYSAREDKKGMVIWLGGEGTFSWMGTAYRSTANGYIFDRVELVQNNLRIPLTAYMNRKAPIEADGPKLKEAHVFYLAADSGLDPLKPWQIEVTVPGTNAAGEAMAVTFPVHYTLPESHMVLPPPPPPPVWAEAWTSQRADISVLIGALFILTFIFMFQDGIAKRRRFYFALRFGFLAFTLGWLGYYAGGQLSIVNIMAYIQAPFIKSDWSYYLLEPIMFILSVYVALTLFVLGRGVFCGWLCPFGSLQEFVGKIARFLKIPRVKIAPGLQQRLWAVKYIIAVLVIGTIFVAPDQAGTAAEVEPFKTAISSHFNRSWPFLIYAGGLLVAGMFVERAFCRFLCPLGGALAVFGRARMFNWLKRRPQCGTQCRTCENDCPIGAIEPSGKINMNECLQCLDCQVDYYDDETCPPLIQRRKRRQVRAAAAPPPKAAGGLIPGAVPAE